LGLGFGFLYFGLGFGLTFGFSRF